MAAVTFSHPDCTVGAGLSPDSCLAARGLLPHAGGDDRRSGIGTRFCPSPRPEGLRVYPMKFAEKKQMGSRGRIHLEIVVGLQSGVFASGTF